MSAAKPIIIAGIPVTPLTVKNVSTPKCITVLTKASRANVSESDRVQLFRDAVEPTVKHKYKRLPTQIQSIAQLKEFQDLDTLIAATKDHCEIYDIGDVFTIVFPDPANPSVLLEDNAGNVKTKSLFSDHASVTVAEVYASIQWRRHYTDDTIDQFHTNMQWSYIYLQNSIEPSLLNTLRLKYNAIDGDSTFGPAGPLLFILLTNELLLSSEETTKGLHDQLKTYNISKTVPGENIKNVSATLQSVSRRIWLSRHSSLPSGYIDTIISIYQTTSVPAFNNQFQQISTARTAEVASARIASQSAKALPVSVYTNDLATVQLLTNMADQFYDSYSQNGTWSMHVKTKASTAQVTQQALSTNNPVTCFNCGKSHHLKDCPNPTDDKRIQRAKSKYLKEKNDRRQSQRNGDASTPSRSSSSNDRTQRGASAATSDKKTSNSGRHDNRFRPPDNPSETRRFIHTKANGEQPYLWNSSTNRWEIQSSPSVNLAGVPPVTAASDQTVATQLTADSAFQASVRAEFAEFRRLIQNINNKI